MIFALRDEGIHVDSFFEVNPQNRHRNYYSTGAKMTRRTRMF